MKFAWLPLLVASAWAQIPVDLESHPPVVLEKSAPEYTDAARDASLEGTVLLSVKIGLDGHAHQIKVMRGLGLGLDEKAVECVRKWWFKPGIKKGEPAETFAQVEVNFRLSVKL
jgi:protein TonB